MTEDTAPARFPRDLPGNTVAEKTFTLSEPNIPRGQRLPWRLIAELIGDGEAVIKLAGPRSTHSGLLVRYADLVAFACEIIEEDNWRRGLVARPAQSAPEKQLPLCRYCQAGLAPVAVNGELIRDDETGYPVWTDVAAGDVYCPDAPDSVHVPVLTTSYTAHFTPEAWVRNNAIEVDTEGRPQEWDCTAFALVNMDYLTGLAAHFGSLDDEFGVTDAEDRFRNDPAAPDWVRGWHGPYTIRIRRTTGG